MRSTFRNQLRYLADLYKTDPDARRKHEHAAKPELRSLEDRTMLSAALHDGDVVALFHDATYANDTYHSVSGITAGIVAIDPGTGAKTVLYQFPDTNADGFADNFQSTGLYSADSYTAGDVAVHGDTVYVAMNYGYGYYGTDGKFDLYKIDAAAKTGSKVAQYPFLSNDLLVTPDGSVIDAWSDTVTTPNSPYGEQIAGVSELDPATGTDTVLYETPGGYYPVETKIRPDGKVLSLFTTYGQDSKSEEFRLAAIDPVAGTGVTVASKAAYGDGLAVGPNGDAFVAYRDFHFDATNPYGYATDVANGAVRYQIAPAGTTATPLGETGPNSDTYATTKIVVTPAGTPFVAVEQFATTSPYGYGTDPATTFYKSQGGDLVEVSKAPWQAQAITPAADGTLLVQWSDSSSTNNPYGPNDYVQEYGVSRIDPTSGAETRLYDVPGTTTTDPYYTSTYADYNPAQSGFAAPPAADPNYFGFTDYQFVNNGVYDDRGLIAEFPAAANKGTVLAEFTAQIWAVTTVSGANGAPTITGLADARVLPGQSVVRTITVGDDTTAAAALTVTAVSSASSVTVAVTGTGATRTVTATLAAGATAGGTVTVTVTDGDGNSTVRTFTVGPNAQPTLTGPANVTVEVGQAVPPVTVTVGDDATAVSALTVTAASSNTALVPAAGIAVTGTGATRTVTITPTAGATGVSTITLTVTDGDGATVTKTFTVTVSPPNTAPTLAPLANVSTVAGSVIPGIPVTVGDAETNAGLLTVTATSSNLTLVPAAGLAFTGTGANRTLTVTPSTGAFGTATITVTVSDGTLTSSRTFVLTVNANLPPVIAPLAAATVRGGDTVTVPVSVDDPNTGKPGLVIKATSSNTTLLPAAGIVVDGTNLKLTPVTGPGGKATVTVTVTDPQGTSSTQTFELTVTASDGAAVNPFFAVGTDGGTPGTVTFYDEDRKPLFVVPAFTDGFTGGVRTASADFDGDGIPDVVVGKGPGSASAVRILSGKDGKTELFSTAPFEASFTGGIYVSVGDINNDGKPDLIITPDEGGGPRVDVYSGIGFSKLLSFFGIDDTSFRGGARSAMGDMNGDGVEDLLVAAGFGGGPRVAGYDGAALRTSGQLVRIFGDFFVFEQSLRNGVFISAGDLNGDGLAELVVGGGPGGGPRVVAFDGKSLLSNNYNIVANFFAGNPDNRGGVRLSVKDLDHDGRGDLVTAAGEGDGTKVTAYFGKDIKPTGTPPVAFEFDSSTDGFVGGAFVG